MRPRFFGSVDGPKALWADRGSQLVTSVRALMYDVPLIEQPESNTVEASCARVNIVSEPWMTKLA